MTDLAKDPAVHETANLLSRYACDLNGYTVDALVDYWLRRYPASWLRLAVIEALYQGRYKAISVDQILTLWHRRGHPVLHFNHEFERIICSKSSKSSPLVSELLPDVEQGKLQNEQPDAVTLRDPASLLPHHPISHGIIAETLGESRNPIPQASLSSNHEFSPFKAAQSTASVDITVLPSSAFRQGDGEGEVNSVNKPITFPEILPLGEEGWSREQVVKQPILQFIPMPEDSEFYCKLKAVYQDQEGTNSELNEDAEQSAASEQNLNSEQNANSQQEEVV